MQRRPAPDDKTQTVIGLIVERRRRRLVIHEDRNRADRCAVAGRVHRTEVERVQSVANEVAQMKREDELRQIDGGWVGEARIVPLVLDRARFVEIHADELAHRIAQHPLGFSLPEKGIDEGRGELCRHERRPNRQTADSRGRSGDDLRSGHVFDVENVDRNDGRRLTVDPEKRPPDVLPAVFLIDRTPIDSEDLFILQRHGADRFNEG